MEEKAKPFQALAEKWREIAKRYPWGGASDANTKADIFEDVVRSLKAPEQPQNTETSGDVVPETAEGEKTDE